MKVVVAGGHGKIGLRLLRLLANAGDDARGLIRDPGQAADLEAAGARPVVCDLERDEVGPEALGGADAVVFAAGAGPGSGPVRKRTMDLGGAVRLIEACRAGGVERYLMISAMGAANPPVTATGIAPYMRAKAEADRALARSGLAYTIVRPGRLTDDAGSGAVALAERLDHRGEVARDDVAAVLFAVLRATNTIGKTCELLAGDTPIEQAVAAL
jgi:uncharacterized protein YbjT (DUF2867 family)